MRKAPGRTTAAAVNAPAGPAGTQTTAANAASAMIGSIAAAGRPLAPASGPGLGTGSGAGSAGPAAVSNFMPGTALTLAVVPPVANQAVGSTFQVAVTAANARDLFSVPVELQYDPKVLALVDVDGGPLMTENGRAIVAVVHHAEGSGMESISTTRQPNTPGVNGQGTVCTVTFRAVAVGDSALQLIKLGAKDSKQTSLPAVGQQGLVHVTK